MENSSTVNEIKIMQDSQSVTTKATETMSKSRRSIKFKREEKPKKEQRRVAVKKKKRVKVVSPMKFMKFIFYFIGKSGGIQITLISCIFVVVINEILKFYTNAAVILLSVISKSLSNLVQPFYGDYIGSALQFKAMQELCLNSHRHKKEPFRRMSSMEIYEMTLRHKDAIEMSSFVFLFEIPLKTFYLIRNLISLIKNDLKLIYFIPCIIIIPLFIIIIIVHNYYNSGIQRKMVKSEISFYEEMDIMIRNENIIRNTDKDITIDDINDHKIFYKNPSEKYNVFIYAMTSFTIKLIMLISVFIVIKNETDLMLFYVSIVNLFMSILELERNRCKLLDREISMYL